MKAVWKGSITFGLTAIPVRLFPATEPHELTYHYVHNVCQTPVKYVRRCPHCQVEVPWEDIVRGYEHHDRLVIVTEEERAALVPQATHSIQLTQCVGTQAIDSVYFDTAYYVEPTTEGKSSYVSLREALARTDKAALGTIVFTDKEHLILLRPSQNALVLHTLFYPAEVRSATQLSLPQGPPRAQELQAAEDLVQTLSSSFAPERLYDRSHADLAALLERKAQVVEKRDNTPKTGE